MVGLPGEQLRIDHHAAFRFLEAFHHDAVAGFETAFHDPIRAELLADFDGLQADGIRLAHDRHLVGALHFRHGALRHEQRIRHRMRLGAHPGVLAGAQNGIFVGEKTGNLQRAGVGIDLPVSEEELSGLRVNRAVGKNQLQFNIGFGAAARRVVPPEIQVRLFAELEINLDRINGRNGREHAARLPDQIADLRQREARQTIHRRRDSREVEIQLRVLNRGFVCFDLRLGGQVRLPGVVQFLLADGLILGERGVTLYVQLRIPQLGLVLLQFGPGLVEGGLKRARVNLKQQITFFHLAAFGIILR